MLRGAQFKLLYLYIEDQAFLAFLSCGFAGVLPFAFFGAGVFVLGALAAGFFAGVVVFFFAGAAFPAVSFFEGVAGFLPVVGFFTDFDPFPMGEQFISYVVEDLELTGPWNSMKDVRSDSVRILSMFAESIDE